MKKLYPLIALIIVLAIAGIKGFDYYKKQRAEQRAQVSYFLSRCVNQSLLSLYQLQANDWKNNPDFHREEAERLQEKISLLPAQVLDGKPFSEWQAAVEVCDRITENSNRQHRTIFAPVAYLAKTRLWEMERLTDTRTLERRKKAIYRVQVSAQAADSYLKDFQSDVTGLLNNSLLSDETRMAAETEIQQTVFSGYRHGNFSRKEVERYLDRQQYFYQFLVDNSKKFTLRGGSLYFYDKKMHREVDDLNRAILTSEVDFYNQWRQVVMR
ncbi:hypothetical protein [Microbulbifer aggregans]|uniref:hypothetical protein n=1 Tax=Microbulbifer aggregans TaxID=1769779 RepID=UPI001CFEDDDA|nr:hypothetical protein [Microbulbifer aggregans]